ncbi:MAG: bifunctional phosphoglucose/phosphomannose isomerase [Chlorobiales bacterium]|nr:bifunctional phosphoglucose/phosphomannose isomerase [Chlorobiales bacterium]
MAPKKLSTAAIEQFDPQQMRLKIQNLYAQLETKFDILNSSSVIKPSEVQNIVITGLGGSAIGGDLARTYLSGECKVPIFVNRNYTLPEFVGPATLVIASSYSGNTEETISAYKDAIKRKAKVFCITSGGEVEKMALKQKHYTVKIPPGYPPRTALGFSFTALLTTLANFGFIKSKAKDLKETAEFLKKKSEMYADFSLKGNLAVELAKKSVGKLPLIYTSDDFTSVVGVRWKGQICENAKVLAYSNVLPELNHNELVGWKLNKDLLKQTHVIVLHDKTDHVRTQFRMLVTADIAKKYTKSISEVQSEGNSLLTRLFSLILLGDWTSYYLAFFNEVDPTPVEVIDYLKKSLSDYKG